MKKTVSLFLALFVMLSFCVYANTEDESQSDFAGGSGTTLDPYVVETAEQLAKIADDIYDNK